MKTTIIRRSTTAVLAGTLLFTAAGCGKIAEKASEKIVEKGIEAGTGAKVDIDGKGGGLKIETDEGSMTFDADEGGFRMETEDGSYRAGAGMPDDWPDDIPLPPGFEVVSGHDSRDGENETVSVTGSVDGGPEEVMAFYTDGLSGWTEANRSTMGDDSFKQLSTTWENGDRTLMVMIFADADEGTRVMINHMVAMS